MFWQPLWMRKVNFPHCFPHCVQAYINNLNTAMEKLADAEAKGDITAILQQQAAIKFNGGGHLNHSIFWKARNGDQTAEKAGGGRTNTLALDCTGL